jgi:ATP-binding cassette, subfamily F, member 3
MAQYVYTMRRVGKVVPPKRTILKNISLNFFPGAKIGVLGLNGSGKSSLLRIMAGVDDHYDGEVIRMPGIRVGFLEQEPKLEAGRSVRESVEEAMGETAAAKKRLDEVYAAYSEPDADFDRLAEEQARLEALINAGGADELEVAADALRLPPWDAKVDQLSGGERRRVALCRLLLSKPDLLLLDEPTNHLDIASLEWLEDHLRILDAAIVLVAHDRWFLEAVGTSVLELEAGRSRFFRGPWHAWRREQAAREIALGRAVERQQAEIARLERFVERFRAKATKARQAQSRVKRLERMERIEREPREARELSFTFKEPERSGRVVVELRAGRIEVPGRVLLEDAAMHVERGEHVILVGANGSGKTTLIDTLVGRRELPAGKLSVGHNVHLGFVSQHSEELDGQGTVLEAAQRATGLTPGKARALLGRFLFSGDEAEKPVAGLSGGELKRLSLAVLVNSGANVLVLDEPTNHLDLESREALEDALRGFPGSLLLVSHDRALLDAVGTRTLAVEGGELRSYEGSWAEYMQRRAERPPERSPHPVKPAKSTAGSSSNVPEARNNASPSKNAKRLQAELEREVEDAEDALKRVEDELADPSAWSNPERSASSSERHAGAKHQVEEAYARLEAAGG